jgi:glycosyltransferase involved in cell wall biosynthesis
MDDLVSVIIPSRNEKFLYPTIKDILLKAQGPIEIIAVLDGYWMPVEEVIEDPRVIYLHRGDPRGMRDGINSAAQIAKGKYLMKSDGHCMFDEGFDIKLKADVPRYEVGVDIMSKTRDNWIVIPRRLRLDAENWCIQETGKPPIDYEYLSSPSDKGVKGNKWNERTIERLNDPEYIIDETMSFQGSCYFITRNHYLNTLGGMSEEGYGMFVREAQEIGLKTFMSGGRVYTNKKTWYAHLHKGPKQGRGYFLDKAKMDAGNAYCDDYWFNNRWDKAIHDMAWLVERFMPVPTWTPELIEQVRKK